MTEAARTPTDLARRPAYDTLMAVATADAYANIVLPQKLKAAGVSGRDAALATELSYGTLRSVGTLDEIVRLCATRPVADIEAGVLTLLRLGTYQLTRTRIPSHAAVASTVDLARATGNTRATGFINAVLRKVAVSDYETWCTRISAGASELGRLAIRHSHPGWIVGAFADALGLDRQALNSGHDIAGLAELAAALQADDARPETHLVAWPGRIGREELAVQAAGTAGPYSPYAVRLAEGGEPGSLTAVRDRCAGVQDEGSQLCAIALTELPLDGPDERWLDLCAGPGGKTALLAAFADQRGARVVASELHRHRADLIRSLVAGWPVEIRVGDARLMVAEEPGFDRVLLDAPCTGLGALRRRPEARWRRSPADLADLVLLQAELLDAAIRLVRPGGVIGYVTCSPHLAETRHQVDAALARHRQLSLLDARSAFAAVADLEDRRTVQLWPHRHGTDAMFFAALRRTDEPAAVLPAQVHA